MNHRYKYQKYKLLYLYHKYPPKFNLNEIIFIRYRDNGQLGRIIGCYFKNKQWYYHIKIPGNYSITTLDENQFQGSNGISEPKFIIDQHVRTIDGVFVVCYMQYNLKHKQWCYNFYDTGIEKYEAELVKY